MTLQDRIKQVRGSLSQKEFARRIGTGQTIVSSWELGKSLPGSSNLEAIRREFGVDLNWLLTGEGAPSTKDHIEHQTADNAGQWVKAERMGIEGNRFPVSTYGLSGEFRAMKTEDMKKAETSDPFLQAIAGLKDIFGAGNATLKAAIMANIEAFKLSSNLTSQISAITDRLDRIERMIQTVLNQHKPPDGIEERRRAFIELKQVIYQ